MNVSYVDVHATNLSFINKITPFYGTHANIPHGLTSDANDVNVCDNIIF